ncbi:RagB/SusD family nutrient uptake outer membrane protein [uncultured Aquimarina sp.]|uniref:RagB/SusD family nutrient uptake outer membrane protein n=1 Tax=uncultured Aquimarina sp. TaxID=575652 RepID=UPI00263855BA|nr:RagB/SusD family nutrient uptake outer membrane protein [uncultured Aquimarina sp.]
MKMNFKTNYFKHLVLMTAVIFMNACTDDLNQSLLDDDSSSIEEFYTDPASYQQALAGIYGNLTLTGSNGPTSSNLDGVDAGTSQYGRGLMNLNTFSTDEIVWSYINDEAGNVHEIQIHRWSAQNTIVRGFFSRVMFSVALVNDYLRQTTDAQLDARGVSTELKAEIATFRSEARLLRALAYYHMLDTFGKAPFITENDPIGNFAAPQYDNNQLFTFIETELNEIESSLVDPRQNVTGRADKALAWMILAKMYLNSEVYISSNRYSDCIAYCERIIDGGYTLADDYKNLFRGDNDINQAANEIIFSIISDGQFVQNFGPTTVMTNGAVGSIEQNGDNLGVAAGGWGGAIRISPQFAEKFDGDDFTNDVRNTIITDRRPATILDVEDRDQGYVLEKYSNVTSTGGPGSDLTFSDVDFPMFRLGDVYLMYAEATLRGGGGSDATALGYINDLRNRANAPNITSGDMTLDFIIDERARELYWELHRRQDLRRFGLYSGGAYNWSLKGSSPNGIAIPAFRELYPIPATSLSANPNLTQNEGY